MTKGRALAKFNYKPRVILNTTRATGNTDVLLLLIASNDSERLLAAAAEHSDVFAILSIKVVFCDNLACLIVIKHFFHQAETHVQNACVREGKGRERREERGERNLVKS